MKKQFQLWATVRSVHDGDTLYGDVDQGIGTWNKGLSKSGMGLRLDGINARELEEPGGVEARDYVASLVPVGTELSILCVDWDKWQGRIDVRIVLPSVGDLSTHLIQTGWAAAYTGVGPKSVPPWPRKAI